nr:NAD(P)-binding domain-containing protein [Nitrososphaerota archaeon]
MKVAVIGGGKIGEAVARSISDSHEISKLIITKRNISTLRHLQSSKIVITQDNKKAADEADVVLISVKAGDAKHVLDEISDLVTNKLVISLMAAVSIRKIESSIPNAKVVRAMPNIAATIGEAITAYSTSAKLSKK